jgi:hypothetical protein
MSVQSLMAEHCPTPEKIKERKINRDYEWTLDERRTLEDVLSVEKLYSVRIKNDAEYIACYYSGSKNLLRLDGKPLKQPCIIRAISGHWESTNLGEHVCKEDDLALCEYDIRCEEINDPN